MDREQRHEAPDTDGSGSATSSGGVLEPEIVMDEPGPLEEPKLLAFYDQLRERIVTAAGRHISLLSRERMDVLLLAPDLFMLLVRLTMDPRVPASSRRLFAGALAYFLLPVDFLPEALLGVGGFVDDVVLVAAVLCHALSDDLEPLAERYWSGSQRLRSAVSDVARAAQGLLGPGVLRRLRALLGRHGVSLGPADDELAG